MLEITPLRTLRLQAGQDVEVEINGSLRSRLRDAIAYALASSGYQFLKSLQFLSRQFFIDTASDPYALLIASQYGITPNAATQAEGQVKATGAQGDTFVGGELLTREDGAKFSVITPGIIDVSLEITLTVQAVEAGAAGNTITGSTLIFAAPPGSVDPNAIVLGTGLVDGFDVESTASVKARTLAFIQSPRRGGSEPDYVVWATGVAGIAKAFARGSFGGVGTVLVIVSQEWDPTQAINPPFNTPIPTPTLIAEVEAVMEVNKPAGLHGVMIQPPVLQNLDPYIVLTPDTPDIRTAVERSLALALADVEPGQLAFYDDLVLAIDRAAGEDHHQLFVSDGVASLGPYNTQAGANNFLIPGFINWTLPP